MPPRLTTTIVVARPTGTTIDDRPSYAGSDEGNENMGDMADLAREREFDEALKVRFENLRSGRPTVIHGRSMTSKDAAQIIASLAPLAKAVDEMNNSARWPAQPPVGSILRWERRFVPRDDAKVYTYVALRATTDRWYVTGRRNVVLDWNELVDLIGDSPCWLVTAYQEIPRPAPDPLDAIDNPAAWFTAAF